VCIYAAVVVLEVISYRKLVSSKKFGPDIDLKPRPNLDRTRSFCPDGTELLLLGALIFVGPEPRFEGQNVKFLSGTGPRVTGDKPGS
jgi:hypothetical protein